MILISISMVFIPDILRFFNWKSMRIFTEEKCFIIQSSHSLGHMI